MERIKTWINKQLLLFKKSVGKICSGFLKFHRAMLVMGVAIFCFYIFLPIVKEQLFLIFSKKLKIITYRSSLPSLHLLSHR